MSCRLGGVGKKKYLCIGGRVTLAVSLMEDYISQLNPQQQAAVLYTDGPSLVIAGAGSGKTRVLTYKIVHLLRLGYEPWRILALTFTNKAAREMRERIEALVGASTASKLWMGTFHSIFARILRQNAERIGYRSNFTIYDASDSKSLLKTIIRDMGLDDKVYKPTVVASAISMAKNALISPDDYAMTRDMMEADARAKRPLLHEIYRNYRQRCFVAGAMDFDDLLYYTNILFKDNTDILHHYREFFRYVLVDEYQDTNFAQHLIVSGLTKDVGDLCVVGDDAQSIYSFRGANIRNILNLKNAYPTLKTFKLEENYRSTQRIIDAANALIAKNTMQIPKEVFSRKEGGRPVEVVQAYSDYEEAFLVANRISQLKIRNDDPYSEFAILYRTNAQSRILEESLRKRNISYRIYGGLSFYQRKEVKDAIAYFRLTVNPDDDEALRRVINFPGRGIGETTLGKLTRFALDNGRSLWSVLVDIDTLDVGVNAGTARKLKGFRDLVAGFSAYDREGHDAFETASLIILKTGMLTMFMSDSTPENISKQENLQELLSGVKEFVEQQVEEGVDDVSLSAYLGRISLLTDQDSDDDAGDERVTLMTVHAAKGLEFKNVFIVGVEEELFPSAMSSGSLSEIEEERRLLYVAITRAKSFCMMSYASSRFRNGQTAMCSPSRFIRDIGEANLKLSAGADIPASAPVMANPVDRYRAAMAQSRRRDTSPSRQGNWRSLQSGARVTESRTTSDDGSLHSSGELRPGMRIAHKTFGEGTVMKIDTSMTDTRLVVDFDNTGNKVLLLKFARFKIIS